MHCEKKITDELFYIGSSDRRLALFENVFPVPKGVSYNSYLVLDEKTVLIDTVDKSVSQVFFENLEYVLNGRKLDYLIVNHMEPDHAATIKDLRLRHPETEIVATERAISMIGQFFDADTSKPCHPVKEGDMLKTGKHTFTFVQAAMVHWPEVMVTYDMTDKVLFSADAFGTFGALSGNLFADEYNFETEWLEDARRYYTNIVGKYGYQVQTLLKKAAGLELSMVCPLHGPVWRKNIPWFVEKYSKWSSYQPEEKAVMIAYASVYGDTENAAGILAKELSEKGIRNIAMYDVSTVHPSTIVSEAFRCSHLIFASTTYNAGIFVNMETALLDLKAHNLQNRKVALIENGSWAASSGGLMRSILSSMKNIEILEETTSLKSSVKSENVLEIKALASAIASDFVSPSATPSASSSDSEIDPQSFFNITYGLFVLSTKNGAKDNGCIINTLCQIASDPLTVSISVNKNNYSNEMIQESGMFNVSIINESANFDLFKRFGFVSGRDTNKFDGFQDVARAKNGILYVTNQCNTYISANVKQTLDMGSHWVYIAEVTHAEVLNDTKSCTYTFYQSNIKPRPIQVEKKTGWVCKVCGYIYEDENLPEDFICPLCKHGADAFEKLQ